MTGGRGSLGIAIGSADGLRDTELYRGPAGFVDAEVIKAKLDEVLEALARIEGREEAIVAALGVPKK